MVGVRNSVRSWAKTQTAANRAATASLNIMSRFYRNLANLVPTRKTRGRYAATLAKEYNTMRLPGRLATRVVGPGRAAEPGAGARPGNERRRPDRPRRGSGRHPARMAVRTQAPGDGGVSGTRARRPGIEPAGQLLAVPERSGGPS